MHQFYKRGVAVLGALTVLAGLVTATLKIGTSGATIDGHYHATVSVNVDSIASGAVTTSQVTVTGAVVGDHCVVDPVTGDFRSTTSTSRVDCKFTSTSTATLYFRNATTSPAFDAGTSSFSVQAWSY